MKTEFMKKFLMALAMLGCITSTQAQWSAYNDHAPGTGTGPNTTTYHILGDGSPASGPLKNSTSGANLPVSVAISTGGQFITDSFGASPSAGTPLAQTFDGFVDFAGSPSPNITLAPNGVVTYTFTGLNPTKTYQFAGSAVRGGTGSFTNRFTLFELKGADSFISAHSAGVFTSAQIATLTAAQAAINTGVNTAGAMLNWQDIHPGADGTIQVVSTKFTGTVPGVGTAGNVAYALTGFRLIEVGILPVTIVSQPESQIVAIGGSATFSVSATGFPLSYQWYRNGVAINGETSSSLTLNNVSLADKDVPFKVVVSNGQQDVTSVEVFLVFAEPPFDIVPFSQVWRYNAAAVDLGTGWIAENYNDNAWSMGPGPLGNESATLAEAIRTPITQMNQLTYYFRTKFVLTNPPSDFTLIVTNMIDDGAVFYLNGQELSRVRMGSGTISFTTTASATVGDASFETMDVPSSVLRLGTNVLAVEAHQVNTTSSDIVFGTRWLGVFAPPAPIVIITQPQDLVVEQASPARFTVEVTGSLPRFQWYKDGMLIPGATMPSLVVSNTTAASAGKYSVVVRNAFGPVTSREAMLTIVPDTTKPVLLSADGSFSVTTVHAYYSEPVTPATATNRANYTVRSTVGDNLTISSIRITNLTNVIITTTAPRDPAKNYMLTVNNVRDISENANLIIANSAVPIQTVVTIMEYFHGWDFYDPVPFFGDEANLGTAWREPGYSIPNNWGQGSGTFHNGNAEFPSVAGTSLSQSDAYITYFLTTFNYTASRAGAKILLRHVVDSGAVIYLNHKEVVRFNMPDGPINYQTPSLGGDGNAAIIEVLLSPNDFVSGVNQLAVELHQEQSVSVNKVFGLQMTAKIESLVTGPIVLAGGPANLTVVEGQPATLEFVSAGGETFQWYRNGEEIPDANDPILIIDRTPLSYSGSTFKVKLTSPTGMMETTNAVLTVVPDTNAPAVLSGFSGGSPNTIFLTFSEPLDMASATATGNYQIKGADGTIYPVSGAMLVDEFNVTLTSTTLPIGGLQVVINNVSDVSAAKNKVAANSTVKVGYKGIIQPWDAVWRYEQTGTDLGTDWRNPSYVDSAWPSGPGILGFPATEGLPAGLTIQTTINRVNTAGDYLRTSYFRSRFTISNLGAGVEGTVIATNVIDDAAAFYINGMEVARIALPSGDITYDTASTRADDILSTGHGIETFEFPASMLVAGENVYAIEQHQGGANSSDIVVGTQLFLSIPSEVFIPVASCPDLQISHNGNQVTISWDAGSSCVLQQANSITGPWSAVQGASNPYSLTPAPGSSKFYRLSSQ